MSRSTHARRTTAQAPGVAGATRRPGRRRRAGADDGAAVVEFALVLPLLMALLLGIVTSAIAFNQRMQLTHATREGARYAASIGPNQAFDSDTWANNVRALIVARSAGDLETADVCVSLVEGSYANTAEPLRVYTDSRYGDANYFSTSGSPCIPDERYPISTNASSMDLGRRVQVTGTRAAEIEAILYSWEGTMTSEATGKSENTQ